MRPENSARGARAVQAVPAPALPFAWAVAEEELETVTSHSHSNSTPAPKCTLLERVLARLLLQDTVAAKTTDSQNTQKRLRKSSYSSPAAPSPPPLPSP